MHGIAKFEFAIEMFSDPSFQKPLSQSNSSIVVSHKLYFTVSSKNLPNSVEFIIDNCEVVHHHNATDKSVIGAGLNKLNWPIYDPNFYVKCRDFYLELID